VVGGWLPAPPGWTALAVVLVDALERHPTGLDERIAVSTRPSDACPQAIRGLISVQRAARDPRDPRVRFNRPRNVYQNRFDRFDGDIAEFEDLIDALGDEDAEPQAPGVADVLLAGIADDQASRATL